MMKKQVKAIVERTPDGGYSIYSDDDTLDYLVTGTGPTRGVAASQGVLAAVGYAECTRPDGSKSEVNCYSAFSAESA